MFFVFSATSTCVTDNRRCLLRSRASRTKHQTEILQCIEAYQFLVAVSVVAVVYLRPRPTVLLGKKRRSTDNSRTGKFFMLRVRCTVCHSLLSILRDNLTEHAQVTTGCLSDRAVKNTLLMPPTLTYFLSYSHCDVKCNCHAVQ